MQFRLVQTFIRSLRCDELPMGQDVVDELRYAPAFNDQQPRGFAVIFDLKAPLSPSNQLALSFLAVFETSEDITEEFRISHFPQENAPAVAYPYLRAFVSQFSVLAGYVPFTLPIRNFTLAKPPVATPSLLTDNP